MRRLAVLRDREVLTEAEYEKLRLLLAIGTEAGLRPTAHSDGNTGEADDSGSEDRPV